MPPACIDRQGCRHGLFVGIHNPASFQFASCTQLMLMLMLRQILISPLVKLPNTCVRIWSGVQPASSDHNECHAFEYDKPLFWIIVIISVSLFINDTRNLLLSVLHTQYSFSVLPSALPLIINTDISTDRTLSAGGA